MRQGRFTSREEEAVRTGNYSTVDKQRTAEVDRAVQVYERFQQGQEESEIPAPWEYLDVTGTTGFAKQLFGATQANWDPKVPYPQYDPTATSDEERPRTIAAGYDPENRILRVTFRDGDVYEYFEIPPYVWDAFREVDSPGKYMNEFIIPRYDARRRHDLKISA